MSLKGFHIFFITISTALALGLGFSCVWAAQTDDAPIYRNTAIFSFIAAALLVVYGFWFYRKMKRLRIIT
ncbi:MAG: hypothetical protein DLM73_15790 [Chthoniobacterales bacterium]|nr:MAG: hypothetical protein DLM73_15790 [Chthoniobacterales bacterium]